MTRRTLGVDAYIDAARPSAKLILRCLRIPVSKGCPEIEEAIKWGHPHFVGKGHVAGMAAFHDHCAFGFWKGLTHCNRGRLAGG